MATPICSGVNLDHIITTECVCGSTGATTPKCATGSVCFSAGHQCVSTAITGPKVTVATDSGKYCKSAATDNAAVSAITGAGFCAADGVFMPDCTVIGTLLPEGAACNCGAGSVCEPEDICFKVGDTHRCFEEKDESGFAETDEFALVGPKEVPTMLKYGQYYDAVQKTVVDTCISLFTPDSDSCVCNPAGATPDAKKCVQGQYCTVDGCAAVAAMNKQLAAPALCGSEMCQKNEYCVNMKPGKTALQAGSFCAKGLAAGDKVDDEEKPGYCTVTGKEGVCYGKDTTCSENGCTCVSSAGGKKSFGTCYVSGEKSCTLGESFDGTDCKPAPTADQKDIVGKTIMVDGPVKCGPASTITSEEVQLCYDGKVYPVCHFMRIADEDCLCQTGDDETTDAGYVVIKKGAVCQDEYGVACPSGFEHTNGMQIACKQSGGGLNKATISIIAVVAALAVVAAITGVALYLKKKKTSAIEKKMNNGENVVSPAA